MQMMFGRQTGVNASSVFKKIWRGESSLTTELLDNVSPEVELSSYGRLHSPGSESPSGLLNGESLTEEPIADLDCFVESLYRYYCLKGLLCIIVKWVVEFLSQGFTIGVSTFCLLVVDWTGLRNAKCGMDAVESKIEPCDLSKEAIHHHPLTPFTISKAIIVGYLVIFSVYWMFCFLKFFAQLKGILRIRHFYYNSLHVNDNEIKTMPWATIIEKVIKTQTSQQLCVVKDLSEHDLIMRLMRKENYLIGMLNKGVLAFPLPRWILGSGPTVKIGLYGEHHRLILTKTLEWTLNWCILQSMFDRNFRIKREFVSNPNALKKRLMVVGLMMLLLSPFLVIFMVVYLFLRHAEQFYNQPTITLSRRWSNLSKWMFREFNEVDHLFMHRINSSVVHASDYLKQFPSPIISIVAKFISFVSGGFAAILIIIAFLEESLLEGHVFGRTLLWYAAVFGAITAMSRAAISNEVLVLDPEGSMSLVVQHTHYMPKKWRGRENTEAIRKEFETLFQYTVTMLLEELASIFLTPFLLLFVVPKKVDDVLQFIEDFTVDVEGVGHVCSFSVFDLQRHGNSKYGSPHSGPHDQRSSQGKIEKSCLSFHTNYTLWEPNAVGKQFLSKLATFREQKFRMQKTVCSFGLERPIRLRSQANPNSYFSMQMPQNLDWITNLDKKNQLYLLDWYYASQPNGTANLSQDIPEIPFERTDNDNNECWEDPFEGRSWNHPEASTSTPFFGESILKHDNSGNINVNNSNDSNYHGQNVRNHWWDRTERPHQQYNREPNASFLEPPNFYNDKVPKANFVEPPDFNRTAPYDFNDNFSDRSDEGQDGYHISLRDSRRLLSRTTFLDDMEIGEDVGLHFDDIYTGETPGRNSNVHFIPDSHPKNI